VVLVLHERIIRSTQYIRPMDSVAGRTTFESLGRKAHGRVDTARPLSGDATFVCKPPGLVSDSSVSERSIGIVQGCDSPHLIASMTAQASSQFLHPGFFECKFSSPLSGLSLLPARIVLIRLKSSIKFP
jgi:hypothetical protein